jgi:hypothetical protein
VVLEDDAGAVLLHTVVKETEVALPPDLLGEGRRYYWRVLALEQSGSNGAAEGDFVTLDAESSSRRRALQDALASSNDAYGIALLAETDRSLGLQWESRDGACSASRLAPEDPALKERCVELESALRE